MSLDHPQPRASTVADLPSEDIVVLASGTSWCVPWELVMLGPFTSCGLLDDERIRHLTVPSMVASAVRRSSGSDAPLIAEDYPQMPVFAPEMPLLDAAVLVAETGWELAVVMDSEPRVVTARSVYRALLGTTSADLDVSLLPMSTSLPASLPTEPLSR